jgi:hypothetical protein
MSFRSRTFGGSSGLWIRKRIQRPVVVHETSSHVRTSAPAAKSFKESLPSTVGWDEVRCRVVYHANDKEDDYPALEDKIELKEQPAMSPRVTASLLDVSCYVTLTKDKTAHLNVHDSPIHNARTSKRNRSYGRQKRVTPLMAEALLDEIAIKRPRVTSEDSSDNEEGIRKDQPPSMLASIHHCGGENDSIATDEHRWDKLHFGSKKPSATLASIFDFNENDPDSLPPPNLGNAAAASIRQPSCTTSLANARVFFTQLDQEHPLQFDACLQTPPRATIRTARFGSDHYHNDPVIVNEYRTYREACADWTPLSLPLFWQQRKQFLGHRQRAAATGLYRGFLDE